VALLALDLGGKRSFQSLDGRLVEQGLEGCGERSIAILQTRQALAKSGVDRQSPFEGGARGFFEFAIDKGD
jgi:hypothetical protein